jgi:hypothetical protein
MEEKRSGIGTRRKTEGEGAAPVAWAKFARPRLQRLVIAPVRARSRVTARLQLDARPVTETAHLLLPVMFSRKSGFDWRIRAITGEFFFARNDSLNADNAGSRAGKFAGQKSPVPADQVIDFVEYYGVQKDSRKTAASAPQPVAARTLRPLHSFVRVRA